MDDTTKLIEQYKDVLRDIIAIGYDYDGCDTIKDFKELVDDLVGMARMALKGKYNYSDYIKERNNSLENNK